MKKRTLILLAISVSALLFTGCQSNKGTSYSKYVTLGEYKGLTFDRVKTVVTDEDVQNEIQSELYYNAETKDINDRPAKSGDTVNLDYDGTIDGEAFEGGSDTGIDLELGAGSFLDDFEKEVIGMEAGETKTFKLTFPEDYDGVVDGKTAEFTVTVNSITETILPEYNDEYVKANSDFTTTAEFEEALKNDLQAYYDEDATFTAEADALTSVVAASDITEYPEGMFNTVKEQLVAENEEFAAEMGMEWSDLTGEEYDIDTEVEEAMNEKLVVYTIAEKEKLTVSDEEYKEFLETYYDMYGFESPDEFKENSNEEDNRYALIYEKVLTFLGENNTFNDITEEEYYSDVDFDEEDLSPEEDGEIIEEGADETASETEVPAETESETEA